MSHLSQALQRYYSRKGNRIVFDNNQSLNKLAMDMWELLGCQQIDPSALSRVLKGERLFTARQLKVFCVLLGLSEDEKDYLIVCLQRDMNARSRVPTDVVGVSPALARDIITELAGDARAIYYRNDYESIHKRHDLIQQFAWSLSNTDKGVAESVGVAMYLYSRTIVNGELSGRVVGKTRPVFRQLTKLAKTIHSDILYGYAHVLMANAYYIAGGYSMNTSKHKVYKASMGHARKAIDAIPNHDHERLFALRTLAASAYYVADYDAVKSVYQMARETIPAQPQENSINALHLSTTLAKGLAASGETNPFAIREYATGYFGRDLSTCGVYEVSSIKEEIDTLRILQTQHSTKYIEDRVKQGASIASEHGLHRQKKYFDRLLPHISR